MQPQPPRTSWRPPELSYAFLERVRALYDDERPQPPPAEPLREGPHVYCGIEHAAEYLPAADIVFHVSPRIPHLGVCWCLYDGRRWSEAEIQAYLYDGEVPRAYWGKDIRPPVMLFVGEREPDDSPRLWKMLMDAKRP